MEFQLTDQEKQILLRTARLSIQKHFNHEQSGFPEPTPALRKKCGAFVSLHKHGQLRGCIGYVVAIKPLIDAVYEMALSSAFNDPRFSPVKKHELGDLEIEISVLSPFWVITDINEIIVGTHGIMLKKGLNSGLLLPQVATEYGWDRETFLSHTCQKAGLPPDEWKKPGIEIEIFSGIVFGEKDFPV